MAHVVTHTKVVAIPDGADTTIVRPSDWNADHEVTLDASALLTSLETVDGAASGLDADLVDGHHAADFVLGTTYTAADVLSKLLTVDGPGSGLDADTLDGHDSTFFQAAAASLTSWAAVSRAAGFDTWVATPSSANLAALVTDETGTGKLVFAGSPALTGTPTFAGSSTGTTGLQASATASGTLTLPAATDTLIGKATTDTLTNKTLDTAGTGNVLKINGTAVSDKTGTGKVVLDTSPTLVTPVLGVAAATSINKVTITAPATSAVLTIADGKTLTMSATITFTGTDGSSVALGAGGTVAYLGVSQTFTAQQIFSAANLSFGTSTAAATYNVGSGVTTSGNTKAINIGTGGASGSTTNIALGSATSGATTNITANSLAASSAVATDASKNLVSVPNTGSGNNVLATAPTLSSPIVGTQSARDNSTKAASTAYVDTATREKLSTDRTYYVRTDGSDSNTGLVNTSGGAFLTIQKAVDTARTLDPSIYTVTIQVGDGTYTGAVTIAAMVGNSQLIIKGNPTTPANVLISTSGDCISVSSGSCSIQSLKLASSANGGIRAEGGSCRVEYSNLDFGTISGNALTAYAGAYIKCAGNYAITGSCYRHMFAVGGAYIQNFGFTVTLTGTPAWGAAYAEAWAATIEHGSNTFTGSATGTRSASSYNGFIDNNGGGYTYLPGNAMGFDYAGGVTL